MRVVPGMRGYGAYSPKANTIDIRAPSEYRPTGSGSLRSVLLHEIQHAIQNYEGFARGGSPKEARTMPEFEQALRQHMAANDGRMPSWTEVQPGSEQIEQEAAYQVYRRLAGEVEARNTQHRLGMSAAERRATPPTETADVPRGGQIVRVNSEPGERQATSHDDAQAIARYNARLTEYLGKAVRLTPASHVPDAARRALAAFDAAFGSRSIVVRNETPGALDFNGVTLRDGVRMLNEDATAPLLAVAGHELIHQLRKDAPELCAELADEIRRQGRLDAYGADLNERAAASGDTNAPHTEAIVEELVADAAGDAITDPAFIEQLARRNPGLFRNVSQGTVVEEIPSSSATTGAKATTMMASLSATWLRVKLGSPLHRLLQTNTMAVHGAAASKIRPAIWESSCSAGKWAANTWRTKIQPSRAIENGFTAQFTNRVTPMPFHGRRTPARAPKSIFS